MVDFNLSPEQELIQETARDFAKTQLLPGVIERDENQIFPKDEIKKMLPDLMPKMPTGTGNAIPTKPLSILGK